MKSISRNLFITLAIMFILLLVFTTFGFSINIQEVHILSQNNIQTNKINQDFGSLEAIKYIWPTYSDLVDEQSSGIIEYWKSFRIFSRLHALYELFIACMVILVIYFLANIVYLFNSKNKQVLVLIKSINLMASLLITIFIALMFLVYIRFVLDQHKIINEQNKDRAEKIKEYEIVGEIDKSEFHLNIKTYISLVLLVFSCAMTLFITTNLARHLKEVHPFKKVATN
ncbi:hypothetical protein SCHIN_v1c07350 [Spiroplasma chinense]|uniref:Transmembrane protein n=1 Tax=Spiroplasma chinense TaxID=216932 RepID=A0A5B9Y4P6_9MOLU|nr:hypothetical protein [Spiroplasma chinense]QEH61930.1 hypothetical protein SCHIN_v1c07350 [Spiroplasma chinense]